MNRALGGGIVDAVPYPFKVDKRAEVNIIVIYGTFLVLHLLRGICYLSQPLEPPMQILKYKTYNATHATLYEFINGEKIHTETLSMTEVFEYSQQKRLTLMRGQDIRKISDQELNADLGESSYYQIQPVLK
ncbi:MAG: hypothetical protein KDE26_08065 [Bacteroidetes bacterium]|nr:hypothetical protein [Bacteroidota bacterium]